MSMSKVYDTPIRELRKDFARTPPGDIGIEIEAEGPHGGANPHTKWTLNRETKGPPKYWLTKEDHSLRNGIEYVTRTAVPLSELDEALAEFVKYNEGTRYRKESIRTSVHYHINVGDLTLNQVLAAIVGYWLIETPLVGTQPPYRIGNLFCLRVSDADFLVNDLCTEIEKSSVPLVGGMLGDNVKYAALNLNTVHRFGSLEFRFNAGSTDIKEIGEWARFFHTMVHRFATMGSPSAVVKYVEMYGAVALLEHVTPPWLMRQIIAKPGYIHEIESNYSYAYMVHNKMEETKRRDATKTETIFNRRHLFSVDPDGDDNGIPYTLPDCVDFSPDEETMPVTTFIKSGKPRKGMPLWMNVIPEGAAQAAPVNWAPTLNPPPQGNPVNWQEMTAHVIDDPVDDDFIMMED